MGTPPVAVPDSTTRERQPPRDAGLRRTPRPQLRQPQAWPRPPLTHAGHAGHVQLEAVKAVAGVSLPDADTPPVLTAVEDPALLSLQPLEALVKAWRVARWCQSSLTLHPAAGGSPWGDGAGEARTDSEQPGAELAPNLEHSGWDGRCQAAPMDTGRVGRHLSVSPSTHQFGWAGSEAQSAPGHGG